MLIGGVFVPTALLLGTQPPLRTEWARQPAWTLWKRQKISCSCRESNHDFSADQPAAYSLYRLRYSWFVNSPEVTKVYIIYSFILSVFCMTTGPKPPPKRFLHIVRSRASSFKWEYPLLSLRSSSSFLRLLPHLLVTSIYPFIFPSITYFRRQFLR